MSEKSEILQYPNSLGVLLEHAETEDLDVLVDYITDKGEGRIALDSDVCKRLVACKTSGYSRADRDLIRKEILLFGGNTMANLYRDLRNGVSIGGLLDAVLPDASTTVDYEEVVRDVAKHMKVKVEKSDETMTMEDAILRKMFSDAFERMSDEEKKEVLESLGIKSLSMLKPLGTAAAIKALRMGGHATYRMAVIVANAVARAILGHGLRPVINSTITRALSIAIGPIGWVVTGLWTIADMASPAYRVTVPCVVHLAYMRQKALMEASSKICPKCKAVNGLDAKFCSECGAALSAA